MDKLESFQLQTMASDVPLRDFTDEQFLTVVLPANGEYSGSAHLTFELENPAASIRKVTAWIGVTGDATVTGPAPVRSRSIKPCLTSRSTSGRCAW